jgi:choline dehydrogenase-like flavoprotein
MSAWTCFVLPVLDSPLLTVITGAQVTGLLFDESGRAACVRLSGGGAVLPSRTGPDPAPPQPAPSQAWSAGDIIVSGGVIGSPQLLLLSGIGPADDLSLLGLDVRADLPGAGENLHDHALATVRTCKMGIDRLAAVAPDLRVHGVDGLRVADAPVMPTVTSGNTNAPSVMIGERCADFLLSG